MSGAKIHVFHTGVVCISPDLAFGGDVSKIKASGIFQNKDTRIWMPVSVYLIEHPKGKSLEDTGWGRSMSPEGEFDKHAQAESLGSLMLYEVNQGVVPMGQCIDEQLSAMGIATSDIDAVLMTHLDCDHANGLERATDAKRFMVSAPELEYASRFTQRARYHKKSWENLIASGIASDRSEQMTSLEWIRQQSLDLNCVESLANHDPDIEPHVIEL